MGGIGFHIDRDGQVPLTELVNICVATDIVVFERNAKLFIDPVNRCHPLNECRACTLREGYKYLFTSLTV